MKVAVIGSRGYVGRHLVRALAREGAGVVEMSSQDSTGLDPATGRLPEGARLDGVDAVVYLAQSPHGRRMPEMAGHMFQINVVSALEAAALAHRCGVSRLVYASTGNVYKPGFRPFAEGDREGRRGWYALSKLQGEQALDLFRDHIGVHVLRLFGVYGPNQSDRLVPTILRAVNEGRPVYAERNPVDPDDLGGLRISLCYIDDVVRAILRICQRGGPDLVNVAGDEAVSIRSAAEAIGEAVGIPVAVEVAERFRDGDLVADCTRLKSLLATPLTPFAEGLRRTLDWSGNG